uniref:Uncharacterized protein n=1 Tax=Mycena chlorophos TaxID=658473 RepID=A0ABQ0LIW0_MYCCL|nr:predicted protein [Mycena chlorophos]
MAWTGPCFNLTRVVYLDIPHSFGLDLTRYLIQRRARRLRVIQHPPPLNNISTRHPAHRASFLSLQFISSPAWGLRSSSRVASNSQVLFCITRWTDSAHGKCCRDAMPAAAPALTSRLQLLYFSASLGLDAFPSPRNIRSSCLDEPARALVHEAAVAKGSF